MTLFSRIAVVSLFLLVAGCNAGVSEIGPAKEAPKVDQADVQKKMQQSEEQMKKMQEMRNLPPEERKKMMEEMKKNQSQPANP